MVAAAVQKEDSSPSPALDKLLTTDQSILLNTVDKLRNHGVSKYIKLPQIIVCGDQSSGKSSVLEAISHISFPRGEGICTTFPTELALRRDPDRTVKVQLKPSPSRPEAEKILLASYQPPVSELKEFEPLVNKAKEHLRENAGENRRADSFFEDTLHVEVTDPKWPPLSLVDLPGLISAPNPQQTPDDVTIVNDLVSKYMENPKSIILAVISASYDLPLQKVFTMIKKYDPLGKRTLCVVTKPDNATLGPNDLPQFVKYAQNELQGYRFDLGWHVVKNRGHDAQNQTLDARDKAEKDFFAQAPWSGSLHRDQLGINKLRDRLSTLLEKHTRAEMPGVLKQIRDTLKESRKELSKLGPARSTSNDQRVHLTIISQRFENLVRQAMNGHYDDPSFFLPELPESDPRKLRAALQNLNESFAKRMHERGHAKRIVTKGAFGFVQDWPTSKLVVQSNSTSALPETVLRSDYIQHIKSLSRQNRGMELIGSPNLRLVRDLFLDQSRPWRALATEHLENVLQIVIAHLSAVSDNVASPETAAALRREIVYDAMDRRHKRVIEKLEELLKPHEKGHPITYDLNYIENSRKLVKADVEARLRQYQQQNLQNVEDSSVQNNTVFGAPGPGLQIYQVISALKLDAEDIEEADCADILNSTQAYYEGALRTFIDNVAILAVEGCLVDGLENVFSATEVVNMDDQKLRAIGGESEQAQAERLELEQKVAALQDAQRECRRAGAIQERQSYEYASGIRVIEDPTAQAPVTTAYSISNPSQSQSQSQPRQSFAAFATTNAFNNLGTRKDTVASGSAFGSAFGGFKPAPASATSPFSGISSVPVPVPASELFKKFAATGGLPGGAASTSTAAPTEGLFRAPASTSTAAPTGGLFGAPASTSTAAPTGGLFGGSASTSTTAPTRGLFGAPASTSTAAPTGGLFGTPASTSAAAPTGGLFGAPASTSTAAPTGGLFGAPASTSTAAPTGGLFGAPASTSTAAPTGGLFGATFGGSKSSASGDAAAKSNPSGTSSFGSKRAENNLGNNPPPTILDNTKFQSNIQNETLPYGGPKLLNIFQTLPLYMSEFMSFEELRLLELSTVDGIKVLELVQEKLNENQPPGKEFKMGDCVKLMDMVKPAEKEVKMGDRLKPKDPFKPAATV